MRRKLMLETIAPPIMPNKNPMIPAAFGGYGGFGISCGSGGPGVYAPAGCPAILEEMLHLRTTRENYHRVFELQTSELSDAAGDAVPIRWRCCVDVAPRYSIARDRRPAFSLAQLIYNGPRGSEAVTLGSFSHG
jgi:hypothetical protein